LSGQSFEVSGRLGSYDLSTPLVGRHQIENAASAVAVAESLVERGFDISEDSIGRGLRGVVWPARFELVSTGPPPVLVDGAHNPHSMGRLVQTLREHFEPARLFVLFGALGGHSVDGMLDELAALSPRLLAVRSRQPRSTPSDRLAALARSRGLEVVFESDSVRDATRQALDIAEEGDLVLGTGSLSVAAEVIEELRGMPPELYPYIKPPADPGVATV
jgi:dihydrofolate synthase/folylpolyglutamate synthase